MKDKRLRQFTSHAVSRLARADGAAADFEAGVVPAVISTGDVARDGARIEQAGWDFTNFRANPVVMFNHDDGAGGFLGSPTGRMPIATSSDERIEADQDVTVATAHFDLEDDFARSVLGKVKRSLINATSVRWLPIETRIDEEKDAEGRTRPVLVFVRQELLEWSFVPLPADPGAVILRADGDPLDVDAFRTPAPAPLEGGAGDEPAAASSLIETLDAAHSLLESHSSSVFTEGEAEAAARLYGRLRAQLGAARELPASARDEIAGVLDELIGTWRQLLEGVERLSGRQADPTRIVAEHLSQVTGRSFDRVYADLTAGDPARRPIPTRS